jgi:hypothetical protein
LLDALRAVLPEIAPHRITTATDAFGSSSGEPYAVVRGNVSLAAPPSRAALYYDLALILSHVSDDRLPAIADVHMLHSDILVPAVTQPSKGLHLDRIGPHQSSRA